MTHDEMVLHVQHCYLSHAHTHGPSAHFNALAVYEKLVDIEMKLGAFAEDGHETDVTHVNDAELPDTPEKDIEEHFARQER